MSEEGKALVRRLIDEAWNNGNLAVIDELLSPDYELHIAAAGEPGRAGYAEAVRAHRAALPDLCFTIDDMIAEGDKVAIRATITGTHKGDYMGLGPTGRPVTLTAISIRRIEAGRIAEEWVELDMLGFTQQLGGVPRPAEGG